MSENLRAPYVSVIKINGQPILPPIVTPELRKELLNYQQQAIKLEKLFKNCRELKKNVKELQDISSRPISQLTFGDNSHIDALNISDVPKVPRKLKNIHLSKDLIEVTQYNANGLKTICSNGKLTDSNDKEHFRNRSSSVSVPSSNFQKPFTPPKPRLIRSNSYTLESPSPILLEHLRKSSYNESNNHCLSNSHQWLSMENSTPCESSNFSSMNTVLHKNVNDQSNFADTSAKQIEEIKSPTIEVYQTDISVQQITVNTNNGLSKEDKKEAFFTKNPFGLFEPDSELVKVLKDIPENYANQIIDLLKKQHIEQKERLERYDNFNGVSDKSTVFENNEKITIPSKNTQDSENLIDFSSLTNLTVPTENINKSRPTTAESSLNNAANETLRRSSTFSMSPSQSLYYSLTSDSETLTNQISPSIELNDVNDKNDKIQLGVLQEKNGYWEGILKHDSGTNISGCSRKLFPEIDPATVTMNSLKREWAASIIGAHVKGFLTRRLLKTEKVQTLIATVKDVLMCALELHHSENIDEKDVELHRRLINQLSAALYAFHDIFFELSIKEQMAVIAADRQRKLEKLKRPQSSRSSARKSVRSSRSDKSIKSVTPTRSSSNQKLISESPSLTKV